MSIQTISNFVPAGSGIFGILDDKYIIGGYKVVSDISERDSLSATPLRNKNGMMVYVSSLNETYRLLNTNWEIVSSTTATIDLTEISNLSSNWNSVYTTVSNNSSVWNEINNISAVYQPIGNYLSGDTVLGDLNDVLITNPIVDQILKYNDNKWINGNSTSINGGAGVEYFFINQTSDVLTANELSRTPAITSEIDNVISCNNNRVLQAQFISVSSGLGGTQIDSGLWKFNIWAYTDILDTNAQVIMDAYTTDVSGGNNTFLFAVSSGSLTQAIALYTIIIVEPTFNITSNNRLKINVFGYTSTPSAVDIHFVYGSNLHYSHINTPLVVRHNDLAGLQGGTSDSRFHLSSSEYVDVLNNLSSFDSLFTTVTTNSTNWDSVYTTVSSFSATWTPIDVTELFNASAGWNSTETTVNVNSTNWDSVYTTVSSFSSIWILSGLETDITELIGASAGWNSTETTVNVNSTNWDSVYTTVLNNSSNWQPTTPNDVLIISEPENLMSYGLKTTLTANELQGFGDACFINSSGKAQIANATAITSAGALFMAIESITGSTVGNYLLQGFLTNSTWSWTIGNTIYLSTSGTTQNTLTQIQPTSSDNVIQILGISKNSNTIYFKPELTQIELV